ncbi:hypothetical protein FCOIX_7948 [Fusarium coicis]|nr:hypothetical protein FCOIX_7948 [Fusarium coicis]
MKFSTVFLTLASVATTMAIALPEPEVEIPGKLVSREEFELAIPDGEGVTVTVLLVAAVVEPVLLIVEVSCAESVEFDALSWEIGAKVSARASLGHFMKQVYPQHPYPSDRQSDEQSNTATAKMYIGIHTSCGDTANHAVESRFNISVGSTPRLWLTLERCCARYLGQIQRQRPQPRDMKRRQSLSVGMERDNFFRIPFLWDLAAEAVYGKTGSGREEVEKWNWEKLTIQVMSSPHPTPSDAASYRDEGTWSYADVGLDVPGGFTNR